MATDERPSDNSELASARVALLIAGSDSLTESDSPDAQKTGNLNSADRQIFERLKQLGYRVECELSENPNAELAYDKALVFISSTFKLAGEPLKKFCDALNEIPTPLIVSAGKLFVPMRMVEEDIGDPPPKTKKLGIFEDGASSHPMTARLYGTVEVSSESVKIVCGKPNDTAIKIAFSLPEQASASQKCDPPVVGVPIKPDQQDQSAIFAYESGRYMCGTNAPARRIGFFLHEETADHLTPLGWVLFDVAVAWATAEKAKPFDRIFRHEWREIRRRRAKQWYEEMEQEQAERKKARQISEKLAEKLNAAQAQEEREEIKVKQEKNKKQLDELNRPPETPPANLTGLALSGGGIRSATFNLGLLQGLNERGWLRMFDYLSTVSGGGFIGAWWSAWLSRSNAEVSDELLNHRALSAPDQEPERKKLKLDMEQKLLFDPNQVRNARGFLRRILFPLAINPDMHQQLSIKLRTLIADGVSAPWLPLLEDLLAEEMQTEQLQERLREVANQRLLKEFFAGRSDADQWQKEIEERPDKIVDALIESAFDWLNDKLFGNTKKGMSAATLYDWGVFQSEGIELSTPTYHLSQDCPDDYRKLQLNRLLLEEAYPYELGHGVFPQREQIEPQRAARQESELARGQWINEETAVDVLSAGHDPVHHLRLFANYLTPRRGLLSYDTWRAVSTFSRNLLLTWLMLLPILIAVVMLGQIYFVFSPALADKFFGIQSWLRPSQEWITGLPQIARQVAKLATYPLGLLLSCSVALAVPLLFMPEGNFSKADEAFRQRVRSMEWWMIVFRNLTALMLSIAIAGPVLAGIRWWALRYYWLWLPPLFALIVVLVGLFSTRSIRNQKHWRIYVRRSQITRTHSRLLVYLVVLALVLGVAGFGPILIDYLIGTEYPKRAGLLVLLAALAGAIFTAIKRSPSGTDNAPPRRRPGAKSRIVLAITPLLVLMVLAIIFSWLTRNLIGEVAKNVGTQKGLVFGACLGIAFSFFLVLTEIRWKGRFPVRFLLAIWVFFVLWGIGAMTDFFDCSSCCVGSGLTAGKVTGLLCREMGRKHWQWSFLSLSPGAFDNVTIFIAWLAGLPIFARFAIADPARWKKRFIPPAQQPQNEVADLSAAEKRKRNLILIGWLVIGFLAARFIPGNLNYLPLSFFSERVFIAWGGLMCGLIAVFEARRSRGNNLRGRCLLVGIYLLLLIFLALDLINSPDQANNHLRRAAFGLFGILLSWVVVMGWTADPNQLSMHLFYRARLVRAYLGASNLRRSQGRKDITQMAEDDDLFVKDLQNCYRGAPYHIINTTLNLVGGSDLATAQRSAAVFTITKNYCGSSRTGYRDTREYMNGQLTLGSAVAISGAAASPAMGSLTPSAAQAMLMTLLNVRLGFWAPTPNKDYWQESQARLWPFLMLREFLSQTNDLASHCYLTDGAHFENSGLYSLVERGCRYVIISDCGADPHQQFHDLGEAMRRCRIDFDAEIDMKINPLLSQNSGEAPAHFAIGTIKYSRRHFESLHYADLSEESRKGIIILFKPVLTGHEDADLIQYGREDAHGFPHQTTADQWYDEAQFESYRRLGQITAHALLKTLEGDMLKEINDRLKSGRMISSKDVKKLFETAKGIAESESPFQKKEVMSASDKDKENEPGG